MAQFDMRAAEILNSVTDAVATLDSDWRFTYLNDQASRMLSRTREELLGQSVWHAFPETVGTVSDREYHRAVEEQVTVSFEQFYPPLGTWFQVRAYPSEGGLSIFFQDITEQAEHGRRERFLAELAERAQSLTDPDAVIMDAIRSVGQFLGVGRCVFGDIDLLADTCTIIADYCADDSVVSIVGVFPFSAFGPFVVAEYQAGRAVAVDDVRLDPVRVTEANVSPYEAMGIRAHITAPVVHSARLVSVIAVHNAAPRRWKPDEVGIVQTVVERTWLTVEVLRQDRALVREADAARQSEARYRTVIEALTEGITVQDTTGLFQEANSSAERILGLTRDQMAGRTSADPRWRTVHEDGSPLYSDEHPPTVALRTGQAVRDMPIGIYRPNGTFAWLSANAELIRDPETGVPTGVVTSFFDITAQREAQKELQARAERETLLGRIGQAVLWSPDPAAFQSTALALLGERLAADRCFYVLYDQERNTARIEKDWCREGIPSLEGEWDLTERGMLIRDIYAEGETVVVEDVAAVPLPPNLVELFLETGQRSYIAVPLFDQGRPVAALTVMMASAARTWSEEEVALVEAAAVQVRGAVEAVRASQREREAQERQRMFLRDVLLSVTEGRLHLCDTPDDLPASLRPFGGPVFLSRESGLRELRHLAMDVAGEMADEGKHDLATAVSEAGMNAVVHGSGGMGWVSASADGTVQVRVEDHGSGITMENLPRATLSRGFSTKATLGHGLKMMLETIDRLYLLTGPGGTTVVLEQERERSLPTWLELAGGE